MPHWRLSFGLCCGQIEHSAVTLARDKEIGTGIKSKENAEFFPWGEQKENSNQC